MKVTLETVLLNQSPALFLAAVLLLLCYFARRSNHHVRAVMDLLLCILCVGLGITLYYLGMLHGIFTIKDFWQVRTPGMVGLGAVAVLAVIFLMRSISHSLQRRQAEKKVSRMETAHQKELEEVRQKAYASGMADAMAAETKAMPAEEIAAAAAEELAVQPEAAAHTEQETAAYSEGNA